MFSLFYVQTVTLLHRQVLFDFYSGFILPGFQIPWWGQEAGGRRGQKRKNGSGRAMEVTFPLDVEGHSSGRPA